MNYTLDDFAMNQNDFNNISGQSNNISLSDLINQQSLIDEEVLETWDAFEDKDLVKVLDGAIDTLFTTLGLLQKLENKGIDVQGALFVVASDNLSKFPTSLEVANATVMHLAKQGIETDVEYNSAYGRYVIRDSNNKVRKPINFKGTDLSAFVPADVQEAFENE